MKQIAAKTATAICGRVIFAQARRNDRAAQAGKDGPEVQESGAVKALWLQRAVNAQRTTAKSSDPTQWLDSAQYMQCNANGRCIIHSRGPH